MAEKEGSPTSDEAPRLPVLRALPLHEVLESDHSVLANSLRRVLHTMSAPGESYAAHGSTPHKVTPSPEEPAP